MSNSLKYGELSNRDKQLLFIPTKFLSEERRKYKNKLNKLLKNKDNSDYEDSIGLEMIQRTLDNY